MQALWPFRTGTGAAAFPTMPRSTTKAKASWESGFFALSCPFRTAALITVGIPMADGNTPGIDNVYSLEKPWSDSGGKFNLDTGEIVVEPDYLGESKFYMRPRNAAGLDAHALLRYWNNTDEVASEIYDIERRFEAADNSTARYQLKVDLESLIPAAQICYMKQATKEVPVGTWDRYEDNADNRAAEERLSNLSSKITLPSANLTELLKEYRRDFIPAMHASIRQYMENFLTLRSIMSKTLPAIRLRDLSQSRFPLVLPLSKHFAKERAAYI